VQQRLKEDTQRLLQAIYDHFHEHASWPTYRELELKFRKDFELYEVVGKLDRELVRFEEIYREDAVGYLTLEGLTHCKRASKDVDGIVKTAALFAKRYIETNGAASVTSEEIKNELELNEGSCPYRVGKNELEIS
jgi:hypothetical protein